MLEQNSNTPALVVAGVTILQDANGRYNLNTLHEASGTGEAKAPNRWSRLAGTKALQHELEYQLGYQAPDLALETVHGGGRVGTYAHELLAIEYAGWISPAFRLKVNQAFIDLRRGRLAPTDTPGVTVVNPLYQQIIAIVQALDTHEQRLQAVEAKAGAAANMAAVALDSQQWITIRQYVYKYGLDRQLPRNEASRYGRYLTRYCHTKGIPVYDKPSPMFGHENEYPENIIRTTLPRWFARRSAQGDF